MLHVVDDKGRLIPKGPAVIQIYLWGGYVLYFSTFIFVFDTIPKGAVVKISFGICSASKFIYGTDVIVLKPFSPLSRLRWKLVPPLSTYFGPKRFHSCH